MIKPVLDLNEETSDLLTGPIFASPYSTFRVDGLAEYKWKESPREYLDPELYDLAFYNKEGDGEPIFIELLAIFIENNNLYFQTPRKTLNILNNLKTNNILEPSFSLQTLSEFYMYNFDSIEEDTMYNLNNCMICLKNIKKDYVKSMISTIRGFSQLIKDYDRGIIKDENVLFHKEKFIENFKNDMDNFLKCNSLDWLYQTSLITDEDFFFIAMFYDNINYVPDILKDDFREIYWR